MSMGCLIRLRCARATWACAGCAAVPSSWSRPTVGPGAPALPPAWTCQHYACLAPTGPAAHLPALPPHHRMETHCQCCSSLYCAVHCWLRCLPQPQLQIPVHGFKAYEHGMQADHWSGRLHHALQCMLRSGNYTSLTMLAGFAAAAVAAAAAAVRARSAAWMCCLSCRPTSEPSL